MITRRLDNGLLALVGRYSFGMFCLHMLFFPMVENVMRPLAPANPSALFAFGWLVAAVAVAVSLAAAAICYHTFERPILDFKDSIRLPRVPRPSPAVSENFVAGQAGSAILQVPRVLPQR